MHAISCVVVGLFVVAITCNAAKPLDSERRRRIKMGTRGMSTFIARFPNEIVVQIKYASFKFFNFIPIYRLIQI